MLEPLAYVPLRHIYIYMYSTIKPPNGRLKNAVRKKIASTTNETIKLHSTANPKTFAECFITWKDVPLWQ